MAQTDIMALQANLLGKESIIREWRDDFSVVFVLDPSGDGYFALINPGLTTIKTAKIPSGDLITDFRIHNDSVFFCGSRRTSVSYPSGMPQGFVGCFDIQQVFNDADLLNYYLFPYTNSPGDHYITVPQRMDLYQVGSTTHIALVSKCELYPMMGVDHRTTLCDVACPVNGWSYNFFFNKDGIEYYTDIVTNPNYVVAVARDTLFQKCFIDVFHANGQFVSNPLLPNNTFVLTDVPPIDDIRVDFITDDKFVLAYQYKNSSHAGSTIKIFHIDPYTSTILIDGSYVTPHIPAPLYGGGWAAVQLMSDVATNSLFFLQHSQTSFATPNESLLCRYDLSALTSGVESLLYTTGLQWQRADFLSGTHIRQIGQNSVGELIVMELTYTGAYSGNCMTPNTLLYDDSYPTTSLEKRDVNDNNHSLSLTREYPILQDHPLENFCK